MGPGRTSRAWYFHSPVYSSASKGPADMVKQKKKNSGEFNWLLFVNKLFVHENSWIVLEQLLKKVLEFYTALLRTMNCAVDLPF